ncbi:N-acetyltransferase [Luteimonas sp. S4-F44]|uniref:N-acetyltransferase n=1 Tax=Luteimonas sp. S4-F44 TaxID=2925842 RepID=UPI001F531F55|nr:N-acetyltransferase [Luteimonas sp. S4-F44]UNK42878.1 N-acetyltransferase [Luteimonas sp. S4-F44]
MIRTFAHDDMDAVLDLWLRASIRAHDFVPPDVWQAQREAMRTQYLPAAEVHVFEHAATVAGFCALVEDRLAALFVAPERQGHGIGTALMRHAQRRRTSLVLSVYASNAPSIAFYRARGFSIVGHTVDAATGHAEYAMQWTHPQAPRQTASAAVSFDPAH